MWWQGLHRLNCRKALILYEKCLRDRQAVYDQCFIKLMLRYSLGAIPISFLKYLWKLPRDEYPHSTLISVMEYDVLPRSSAARSIRIFVRYSDIVMPVCPLKYRDRYAGARCTCSESAESVIFELRFAFIYRISIAERSSVSVFSCPSFCGDL